MMKLLAICNSNLFELGNNESVSLSIIDKIYITLEYDISGITEIKK